MHSLLKLLLALSLFFLAVSKAEQEQSDQVGVSPIKHFIVLMMENRSFDNLLGFLHTLNPDIDGLDGTETQPLDPSDPNSPTLSVSTDSFDTGPDDPPHDFDSITTQIYGFNKSVDDHASPPLMNGFVYDATLVGHLPEHPITVFTNATAPVLNTLAMEYAVFDKWYCSLPGPTDPNRAFFMSGTSDSVLTNFNGTLWGQESFFNSLTKNKLPWRAYYEDDPWAIMYFADMYADRNARNVYNIRQFFKDMQNEDVSPPQFIFLQPSLNIHAESTPTWQHPDASVSDGEGLIKRVYEAVRSSPYWEQSALLITYDEHGGFYDHVPPPQTGVPPPDNRMAPNGFGFDRLGVRVPAVLVSPWVQKGLVIHEPADVAKPFTTSQYESTSMQATVNQIFGVTNSYLSDRVAWAATFGHLFEMLQAPRADCPAHLPDPAPSNFDRTKQMRKPLNDHQLVQIDFYCRMNYGEPAWTGPDDEEHECGKGLLRQGEGSLWLEQEIASFEKNILLRKRK